MVQMRDNRAARKTSSIASLMGGGVVLEALELCLKSACQTRGLPENVYI